MGIKKILDARKIVLVATGMRKAEAIGRLLADQPKSEDCPATALIDHPNVEVICDEEAAALTATRRLVKESS